MRSLVLVILLSLAAFAQGPRPWFLGPDGGVYDPDLHRLGLGTGTSMAVSGATVYLVGTDQRLWSSTRRGDWQPLSGSAKAQKIVAGPGQSLYILGLDGGVYRRQGNDWQRQGLAVASDLAVGPTGTLYVIGTDSHVWSNAGGNWAPFNLVALGQKVAAGDDGSVYLIGTDNGVWRLLEGDLTRLGLALGKEISVGPGGELAIIGTDDGVYLYHGDWSRLGTGTARQVVWPY